MDFILEVSDLPNLSLLILGNKLNDTSKNNQTDLECGTFCKTVGLVSSKCYYHWKKNSRETILT